MFQFKTFEGFVCAALLSVGCAGEALGGDDPSSAVADLLPAPGCYLLTAPLASSNGRGCSVIAVATVNVAADGTAEIDPCPRGWSCFHDAREPLGEVYSPAQPKIPSAVCNYDVTAGTFADPRPELVDHGGCP